MRALLVALVLLLVVLPARAEFTGHDDHLFAWLLDEEGRLVIAHQRVEDPIESWTPLMPIAGEPVAIASHGARVWVAFAPANDGGAHEIYSLEVRQHPATGRGYPVPHDRLLLAGRLDLPAAPTLAATSRGPVVVTGLDEIELRVPQVSGDWETIPGPSATGRVVGAVADGPAGAGLALGIATDEGLLVARCADLREPSWSTVTYPLTAQAAGLVRTGDRLVGVGSTPSEATLTWLQDGAITTWCRIGVEAPVRVAGVRGEARLLMRSDDAPLAARVDTWADEADAFVPVVVEAPSPGALMRWPLLLGLVMFGLILAGAVRPAATVAEDLPIATLGQRIRSAFIDLLPGFLVALALGIPPADILVIPMVTFDPQPSIGYFIMVGTSAIIATLGEVITGRSLGKRIVGLALATVDGEPLPRARIMVRAAIRIMILIVPPMIVVMALTHHRQGVHDILAQSVVLDRSRNNDPADD